MYNEFEWLQYVLTTERELMLCPGSEERISILRCKIQQLQEEVSDDLIYDLDLMLDNLSKKQALESLQSMLRKLTGADDNSAERIIDMSLDL